MSQKSYDYYRYYAPGDCKTIDHFLSKYLVRPYKSDVYYQLTDFKIDVFNDAVRKLKQSGYYVIRSEFSTIGKPVAFYLVNSDIKDLWKLANVPERKKKESNEVRNKQFQDKLDSLI